MNASRESLAWRVERLRAMSPGEILLRLRKKLYEKQDARVRLPFPRDAGNLSLRIPSYPILPPPDRVPSTLRDQLERDRLALLAGEWSFFTRLRAQVDLPPEWSRDYLSKVTVPAGGVAFELNHRRLPPPADIKGVWELSRWQHLTRLAMAAYILQDETSAETVATILDDWIQKNPAFRGWNWTSALESGTRLLQIAWIDALLAGHKAWDARRNQRLQEIVPVHAHYTWRHRTFGSSANNHLLGELAGLIAAAARWPDVARFCAPIERLQLFWEREVLGQFAADGGNREQALNYHLYSLELCLHARSSLSAAGRTISPGVTDRLDHAAAFYAIVQSPHAPWDYGDSDDAFALPLFLHESKRVEEWHDWLAGRACEGISFWLGDRSAPPTAPPKRWTVFSQSGYAIAREDGLMLRLDASPLGYLSTAAHGHCDALHLSAWLGEHAVLIDPGTGFYYGDPEYRQRLAAWTAHNGPFPGVRDCPSRRGTFLWARHHPVPQIETVNHTAIRASLSDSAGSTERSVEFTGSGSWMVTDRLVDTPVTSNGPCFSATWQFAPDAALRESGPGAFLLDLPGVRIAIEIAPLDAAAIETSVHRRPCSPSFKRMAESPALEVRVRGAGPCGCVTKFVASHAP
jgi:hypothetical protein